jgi:hypothetical protein
MITIAGQRRRHSVSLDLGHGLDPCRLFKKVSPPGESV